MMLGIAIVAVLIILIIFYFLAKGPKWLLPLVGFLEMCAAQAIKPGDYRELHLLTGILQLTGIVGLVLGIILAIQAQGTPKQKDESKA